MKIQGQKVSEIELKNISNKSGIYCYQNIKNDKIYVGQSIHLRQRFKQHLTTKTTSYFETELQKNTDNFIFKVLCENDNYTGDVLDQLEKQFIAEYHAYEADGGYNRTHGNGIFIDLSDHQAHMGFVRNQIVATIVRWIGGDSCTGKRILLIGGFEGLAERLIQQGNKVTIITDDYTYYPTIDAEISRVDTTKDTKELENMIKDIKKDEYDIIIANPPYNKGNEIVANFVSKAKESIVLAPANCYQNNNVYKHIINTQLVDPKAFKDANITCNLNIAKMIDKEIEQSYHDIYLDNYCDPNLKNFYKQNIKIKAKWKVLKNLLDEKNIDNYDISTSFIIPSRATNGVCKSKNTADFYYNVFNEKKYIGSYVLQLSKKAKKNLAQFYYYNSLMNRLLRGLNNTGGSNLCYLAAIPHIDWSIDRDYEHCTLDDIMKWLEEDNQ